MLPQRRVYEDRYNPKHRKRNTMNISEMYNNTTEPTNIMFGEDITETIDRLGIDIDMEEPQNRIAEWMDNAPDSNHVVTTIGQGPKHVMLIGCVSCPGGWLETFGITVTIPQFIRTGRTNKARIKSLQELSEVVAKDLHAQAHSN